MGHPEMWESYILCSILSFKLTPSLRFMTFFFTGSRVVFQAHSFLRPFHLGTLLLHKVVDPQGFIFSQLLFFCTSFFLGRLVHIHCFSYQIFYHEVQSHSFWPRSLS